MQQHVGQVVAAWIHAVDLAIQHVREGRQRKPLAERSVGQRPPQPGKRQSRGYVRVFVNVNLVVEAGELVMHRLAEDQADRQQQKNRNGPDPKAGACRSAGACLRGSWPAASDKIC